MDNVDRDAIVGGGRILPKNDPLSGHDSVKRFADCSSLRCFIWTDPSADLQPVSMIQEAVNIPCHNARASNTREIHSRSGTVM